MRTRFCDMLELYNNLQGSQGYSLHFKDVETKTPRHSPEAMQHKHPDHETITDHLLLICQVALRGLSHCIPTAALWGRGTLIPKLQIRMMRL